MKYFIYAMISVADAPAGLGSCEDWFYRYKWGKDGEEVFLPVPSSSYPGNVEPGDVLIPVMVTGRGGPYMGIIGAVAVTSVFDYPLSGSIELWFKEGHDTEHNGSLTDSRLEPAVLGALSNGTWPDGHPICLIPIETQAVPACIRKIYEQEEKILA